MIGKISDTVRMMPFSELQPGDWFICYDSESSENRIAMKIDSRIQCTGFNYNVLDINSGYFGKCSNNLIVCKIAATISY